MPKGEPQKPTSQQSTNQNTTGQSSTDTTSAGSSTARQLLSPEQEALLGYVVPNVQRFAAHVPQRYQGPTVAGFDPSQVAAQETALGAVPAQSRLAGNAADTSNFYLGGDVWNPESNPNLQNAIGAATRPITQNFNEILMPAIRGEAIKTGGLGGSRQGVAEGIATRGAAQAIGDTSSKIVQDLYRTNMEGQLKALGLLPQTQQAQLAPTMTTGAVGDVRQGMSQALLDQQLQGFNAEEMLRMAPLLQAREILSIIQGLPGGGASTSGAGAGSAAGSTAGTATGTSTAINSVPKTSPWQQALGGAATGASMGSMFGPVGMGVGAAGGAVLPFLFR